ncbi:MULTISPECIES: SpoIIE family protein phosphatase [Streptomyces]|uniref:SpoIIE family protein phosphatase n=1 Tax=Streptomyces TaxID=1883 RepID=UPI0006AFAB8C|nr:MULTISPECIES: SpoIIE family protein phosphatase [unclassified Streptomyces]KOU14713.1 phosphatase [Streptomyces sp. WM6349]KOV40309.1 phosphatase [Streptomyces sp. H036]
MTHDAVPPDDGASPEVLALAKVVARLRSEIADLEGIAAATAVIERAKGVLMAQTGISADAAYETLLARGTRWGRTLLEECWLTLGQIRSRPTPRTAASPPTAHGPGRTEQRRQPAEPATGTDGDAAPADESLRALLPRLAEGLAEADSEADIAELLRVVLGEPVGVDGVMIYSVTSAGSLELTGHAGITESLADQWHHVPPLSGVAALEAIAARAAVWLEDPATDARRYLLIGEAPGQWPSRAWIPVPSGGPSGGRVRSAIGFMRSRPGPFDQDTRTVLRQAVRLCAPLLRGSGPRGDGASRTAVPDDVASVQAILDVLSGPAVLLTPLRSATGEVEDYRIDGAAPESVDVQGRRGKELVGRRVLETYPTVAGTALWEGYADTLTTGAVYEGEPFTYQEVGAGFPQESVYSVRATRLGGRLVVSWIRHDLSEREARRLTDMQRLGNLGWAGWQLATDGVVWSDQVYAIFDRDPALGPIGLEDLPRHVVPDDRARIAAAVHRLLRLGQRAVDQPFRITTADGVRHVRMVVEARADASGSPVEVHGFFQDVTALRDAELALRESERAVLVQSGMLQAERALAARLQATLLPIPEQSVELAGLCVEVAYVPSESGVNVGGDWYSAIELPDRSALFVVGDVAGHGLAAVGTMAQLRFTAKGMATTGSALIDVLRRLNNLLLNTDSEPSATATMVIGRYQPDVRRLTWARAGHLPPLLIRDGRADFLAQPDGCLLGAARDSVYGQAVIDLQPGDHLLLYTDGLVERPGEDIDLGLGRLAKTALQLLRDGVDGELARTLAAQRAGNLDDLCVLDIHVPDDAE